MTPPAPGSRNVLLTGASSGIGRGSALRSARAGDRVVALARHAPALRALAAEHPGIEIWTCHLRDGAQRPGLVERVLVAAHPSGAAGHGPRPARAAPAGRLRERRRPAAAVPLLGVAVPAVSPTSCPDTGGSWPCRWPAPRRCACRRSSSPPRGAQERRTAARRLGLGVACVGVALAVVGASALSWS